MHFIIKLFPEITIKSPPVRRRLTKHLRDNLKFLLKNVGAPARVVKEWDKFDVIVDSDDPQVAARVTDILSHTPGIAYFAQVKSCNYLPNVMTKKESVDKGADFAVNITEDQRVAEGPTENILILTDDMGLYAPEFDYTLRGTTLMRTLEIAQKLRDELSLKDIGTRNMSLFDLQSAREIMMVGTTLGVMPVTKLDNKSVNDGKVGNVARRLNEEIQKII